MIVEGARRELSLRMPIALSALLHVAGASCFLLARHAPAAPLAPMYKVSLVAAPAGERRIGVVSPTPALASEATPATAVPAAAAPKPAAPIARSAPVPERAAPSARSVPVKPPPKRATPNAAAGGAASKPGAKGAASRADATPPSAGGGPVGGKGADVANVNTAGIAFPYPGYLENVVRQIALRFRPSRAGSLHADVAFLIRRDGSIAGLRLTTRSGVYSFDTEALGSVEAAAQARAFGPLPQGFSDDVLPVIFSFDPRLIR